MNYCASAPDWLAVDGVRAGVDATDLAGIAYRASDRVAQMISLPPHDNERETLIFCQPEIARNGSNGTGQSANSGRERKPGRKTGENGN